MECTGECRMHVWGKIDTKLERRGSEVNVQLGKPSNRRDDEK